MKKHLSRIYYFEKKEIVLWGISVLLITASFLLFNGGNFMMPIASVIGVTSLIFNAKGNPIGQFLMVVFSILYGVISFSFSYYGEMITYLGMTAPMAVFSLISWIKNPYDGNRAEVRINRLKGKEILFMSVLTLVVTIVFYFILVFFETANILMSTVSITTSFLAVYLTFRRSTYYALAYAANDIVLIVLWVLATQIDAAYAAVVVCFAVFLVNDIYGFLNWSKMQQRQESVQIR